MGHLVDPISVASPPWYCYYRGGQVLVKMDPLKRQLSDPNMEGMFKTFELLRLMDREMPAQLVSCFFYVASHNPCHKQALEEDLGLVTSSASRLTDWLSPTHRLKKPGLGLIEKYDDPSNRRRSLLKLTPKGVSLVNQIKELLYGSDQHMGSST